MSICYYYCNMIIDCLCVKYFAAISSVSWEVQAMASVTRVSRGSHQVTFLLSQNNRVSSELIMRQGTVTFLITFNNILIQRIAKLDQQNSDTGGD